MIVAKSYLTLWDPVDCKPATLLCPWNAPSENTGVVAIFFSRSKIMTNKMYSFTSAVFWLKKRLMKRPVLKQMSVIFLRKGTQKEAYFDSQTLLGPFIFAILIWSSKNTIESHFYRCRHKFKSYISWPHT